MVTRRVDAGQLVGPDVQVLGDAVVLRGAAAREVARILRTVVTTQTRQNGIQASPLLLRVLAAGQVAEQATHAQRGTTEARTSAEGAGSEQDEIDAKEAADMIGCTREWAGRMARDGRFGRTRKVRGVRRISRAGVEAYMDDRDAS